MTEIKKRAAFVFCTVVVLFWLSVCCLLLVRFGRAEILTVLFVKQNLELVADLSLEALFDTRDGLFVGELAVHEAAAT